MGWLLVRSMIPSGFTYSFISSPHMFVHICFVLLMCSSWNCVYICFMRWLYSSFFTCLVVLFGLFGLYMYWVCIHMSGKWWWVGLVSGMCLLFMCYVLSVIRPYSVLLSFTQVHYMLLFSVCMCVCELFICWFVCLCLFVCVCCVSSSYLLCLVCDLAWCLSFIVCCCYVVY